MVNPSGSPRRRPHDDPRNEIPYSRDPLAARKTSDIPQPESRIPDGQTVRPEQGARVSRWTVFWWLVFGAILASVLIGLRR